MWRQILAVFAGYTAWTLLWLSGNAWLFADAGRQLAAGTPFHAPGPLVGLLLLAGSCSLVAGIVLARLLPPGTASRYPLGFLGLALVASGTVVSLDLGTLLPLWYHAAFLLALVPLVWWGTVLGRR